MKRKLYDTRTLILVAGCIVALAGCTEKKPEPEKVVDPLVAAVDCLRLTNYDCAHTALAKAHPGDSTEALITLTNLLEWLQDEGRTLVELAALISGQTSTKSGPLPAAEDLVGSKFLNRAAYKILEPGWQRLQAQRAALNGLIASESAFALELSGVPVVIGNVPTFVYRGTVTRMDFTLLASGLDLTSFALALILSADLDFPVADTVRYSKSLPECANDDPYSRRRCGSKVSAFAIFNAANLLAPEPSRGAHFQDLARASAADFYSHLRQFHAGVEAQGEGQDADYSLSWRGRPAGGGWITWQFGAVPLTPEEVSARLRGEVTFTPPYKAVDQKVQFTVQPGAVTGLTEIYEHLEGRRPQPVSVNDSVLPPVLTGLEFAMQSDAAMTLIQLMAEGIDEGLAADLRRFVENLRRFYSDFSNADALQRLFEFLLPNSLSVDLDRFFDSPIFLRTLLPDAVSSGTYAEKPTWEWLVEWECDSHDVDVMQCSQEADLFDSVHFSGTAVSLPADGILYRSPYIGYSDPSFDHTLYVDPSEIDPQYPNGLTWPDLSQFNRLVQETGRELQRRME